MHNVPINATHCSGHGRALKCATHKYIHTQHNHFGPWVSLCRKFLCGHMDCKHMQATSICRAPLSPAACAASPASPLHTRPPSQLRTLAAAAR
jgi:hypothetical protein